MEVGYSLTAWLYLTFTVVWDNPSGLCTAVQYYCTSSGFTVQSDGPWQLYIFPGHTVLLVPVQLEQSHAWLCRWLLYSCTSSNHAWAVQLVRVAVRLCSPLAIQLNSGLSSCSTPWLYSWYGAVDNDGVADVPALLLLKVLALLLVDNLALLLCHRLDTKIICSRFYNRPRESQLDNCLLRQPIEIEDCQEHPERALIIGH